MKMNFLQTENAIQSRLARIQGTLYQRCSHCVGTEAEEDNSSTQVLQIQKNQLIDLQEHSERHCKTLKVFGFNSAKYHNNFIMSYLLPILINERDVKPIVMKKDILLLRSNFVRFNFLTF